MEAGELDGRHLDLIDAMIESADTSVSDERIEQVERHACPGCGCCSGMFTANSMNCLNEAIGLALPGNGTIVATHKNRIQLSVMRLSKSLRTLTNTIVTGMIPCYLATSLPVRLS